MQKQNFDHGWSFHLGDTPETREMVVDDSDWQRVDLPHDWSIGLERDPESPSGVSGGYFPTGRGWYRKPFDVPEDWREKKVWIEFEGVYMNSELWVNEHFIGRHPYGYTSFHYDLTPYLNFGAKNLMRIFVDNACQMNSRWYSGSGIYRHVCLLVGELIHVAHWGISITTPEVNPLAATLAIRAKVENETDGIREVTVRSHILASDGTLAGVSETSAEIKPGEQNETLQTVEVAKPQLWSPDSPSLYRLETDIMVKGKIVDTTITPFGIRSLHFDAGQGFLLNGVPMKLKGGCVHHDNGVLGAASYDRAEERKVELLKSSGFNAIRCAHNPPAPAFLDACDRLGMLVIDEAFDCWRHGKNPCDYHVAFDDWWPRDVDSMVCRDHNHPSIILWSIGNEIAERGRPEGVALAKMLAGHIRALDASRPVTSAVNEAWKNEWAWQQSDDFFAVLDVCGYNYMWVQYAPDHRLHPQRVMVGTESFPKEAFQNWMSVLENHWVTGDFVWAALDYLGESGIGRVEFDSDQESGLGSYPWHQANCGDFDVCGFKRPQSYYRDILWGNGGKLFMAVHYPHPESYTPTVSLWGWPDVGPNWTWPGHEGQPFKVDVYSACEKVELLLNGRSLGMQPTTRAEKFIATFEVPYQPGELKAVGYAGGQRVVEVAIESVGAPAQIRLTPDRNTLQSNAQDLCYVTAEIVDTHGRLHPHAEDAIYFTVEGPGTIAAIGSGNPMNTETYCGNQHKAYRGRCLIVLKSSETAGEIRLRAQADGLERAELVISTLPG